MTAIDGGTREQGSRGRPTSASDTSRPRFDPGSFRDRGCRVVERAGTIYRLLDSRASEQLSAVMQAPFFHRALSQGQIVGTELEPGGPGFPMPDDGWTAAVRHEKIPFISYPYEWTFGMLRDAALLQLDLLDAALEGGFILKDASAYNVQWRGSSPTFIDVGSFERYQDGAPWIAYRQFCQLFLYPLMLQAYKNIPFHPWLRGRIDGVTPTEFAPILGLRDLLRPGALVHGWLHSKATARAESGGLRAAPGRFTPDMIRTNVRGLRGVVQRLSWSPGKSTWSDYRRCNSYSGADRASKDAFVTAVMGARRRSMVWDLGANTGDYARAAAAHADYVLAIDSDHLSVERLHVELRHRQESRVLPLVVNLADPSPGLGWRGRERGRLEERGRPDLVLALALIHHLVIGANLPIDEVVEWLASLGGELLIEWVERHDPMVVRLLAGRADVPDYRRDHFERCLAAHFAPGSRAVSPGGTRVLYHLVPLSP